MSIFSLLRSWWKEFFSSPAAAGPTLRTWAQKKNIDIGVAVTAHHLRANESYRTIVAQEFTMITPENALKMGPLLPTVGTYDFREADEVLAFAKKHNQSVRGHTLVWHQQLPAWLPLETFSVIEAQHVLDDHITKVVKRYAGQIGYWDVVNEAVADDGALRDTPWLRSIGVSYITNAFQVAHAADPQAKLFYNDYGGEGMNKKSDAIYVLVRDLLRDKVPLHGIGLQMHLRPYEVPIEEIAHNIRRLAALGLEIHITELDLRLALPATSRDQEQQAQYFEDIFQLAIAEPACRAIVLWGVSDATSWIPGYFSGYGEALVFDEQYRPKAAHRRLVEL